MSIVTTKPDYNLLDIVTIKHKRGKYILLSNYGVTCYIALRIDTINTHHVNPIIISRNDIKEVIENVN